MTAGRDRAELQAALALAMGRAALERAAGAREAEPIDIHVAFMRGAGGAPDIRARATGGGRTICFCEAEALDAAGAVVAQAMGTFRYRDPGRCAGTQKLMIASAEPGEPGEPAHFYNANPDPQRR